MTVTQLTDYILIVVLALVAICQGISTGIDFFTSKSKKPLPKEVMTINEIAKFVVSEAATLDVSGAEKKAQAVQALLNQAKKEGKPITESVAKGAVQHAYDQAKQEKEKATPEKEDETAQPIGFVQSEDDAKND
ncbi:phage holin, LLH family [Lactobacillus gallinarum]|uniref:phage holin, LLH family n=1 Tax=Lactobacillus gallinarum TaxID=52242 RepID=UPI00248DC850|nr:phage holin, LLH family [Lactobacillus gallinarum]